MPFYKCNYCKEKEAAQAAECLQPDLYTPEKWAAEYAEALQEQQKVTDWVGLCLASPDPQGTLDSMLCETEFEMRVWAATTRVLREQMKGCSVVRISREGSPK